MLRSQSWLVGSIVKIGLLFEPTKIFDLQLS